MFRQYFSVIILFPLIVCSPVTSVNSKSKEQNESTEDPKEIDYDLKNLFDNQNIASEQGI